jgi:hypothetical protein
MSETINQQNTVSSVKKHRMVIIVLAVILTIEAIWAIKYTQSVNTKPNPETKILSPSLTPKPQIALMRLDPVQANAKMAKPFNLDIVIETKGRDINGVDAQIIYDPLMLSVVDQNTNQTGIQVKNGSIYDKLLINKVDPVIGKINLTASRLNKEIKPFNGSAVFATLVFQPKKEGSTLIRINYEEGKTNTSNITESKTSNNILTDTQNATVQIVK